ncbi:hypothetical protein LA080_007676 [Diaporthe eres]|nr:hypothetical protein LA080_007676 [Diaporthe eres]
MSSSNNDQSFLATSRPEYQAPLKNCDHNGDFPIVPSSYIIYLAPEHSLAAHSSAIGQDIKLFVHHIYNLYTEKVVYVGRPVDKQLLEKIRSDQGVELVECEAEAVPDESGLE